MIESKINQKDIKNINNYKKGVKSTKTPQNSIYSSFIGVKPSKTPKNSLS